MQFNIYIMLRSGIVVASLTFLSRCFGLIRELFIAALFGSSNIADCINIAFKFPNLFRRIFGEGALSATFIPIFSKKLQESVKEAKIFSGTIFLLLLIILILLIIIIQIIMPYIMIIIAPGFLQDNEKYNLALILSRITSPYLLFISLTSLFGGMLNSINKFAAFACTPIIMNISVILFTIILKKNLSAHYSIAISLVISGILQLIFTYYCLLRAKLHFPLIFNPKNKEVKLLIKNMMPTMMSYGTQQLNLFISQSIASFLPGAISILAYAERLYQFPLAIIGVTFSTILLPELSRIYKNNDHKAANDLQNKAIKIALSITIPAMCGLIMLAKPIIHVIYERGLFSVEDTINTSNTLIIFAFGLPAFILSKILIPIFHANLDSITPLKITLYSFLLNAVLNVVLLFPFKYIGIAVGFSTTSWCTIWWLNKCTKKYGNFTITKSTKIFIAKILLNSIIMSIFLLLIRYYYHQLFFSTIFFIKLCFLLLTIVSAIVIFTSISLIQNLHKL